MNSLLSVCLPVLLTSALSPQDSPPAWLGSWGQPQGPAIRFEAGRCAWLRDGNLVFYRLRQGDDTTLLLERWGKLTPLALEVEGDWLQLDFEGTPLRLPRLASDPSSLRLEAYDLPAAFEIDPETVADLAGELAARVEEDQRVRRAAEASAFDEATRADMRRVDRDNTEFLISIIEEMGWIDAVRFGAPPSEDAFLLVQHSEDLRLMLAALPHIERDVRAGRMNGQSYALLYDRLQLNLGRLQRYGSQLGSTTDGESVLMPCEDPESVDERRAEMGMEPLASYLAWFEKDPLEPIRTLEEALAGARQPATK